MQCCMTTMGYAAPEPSWCVGAGDDLLAYTAQARRVLHAWLLLQCQEDAAGYELPEPWLHIALQVRGSPGDSAPLLSRC